MTNEEPLPGEREWRVIPDFPKYEINSDGDVRNVRTKRVLRETEKKDGTFYYSLNQNTYGPKIKRSYERLLYSAWPEVDGEWKTIPGYENYEISKTRQVRNKLRIKNLTRKENGCYLLQWVDEHGKRRKHYWSEAEIGDEQDWDDFWNDVEPEEMKEAA